MNSDERVNEALAEAVWERLRRSLLWTGPQPSNATCDAITAGLTEQLRAQLETLIGGEERTYGIEG